MARLAGGWTYGAGTHDVWEKMYGRRKRPDTNSRSLLLLLMPFPLCLSLFVSHSPITICVNGNQCQARQWGGRDGSVGADVCIHVRTCELKHEPLH